MSKWYEVVVTTIKKFAVEVDDTEDEDEAVKYACDEVSEFTEAECKSQVIEPVEIDRLKRHADEVLPIED